MTRSPLILAAAAAALALGACAVPTTGAAAAAKGATGQDKAFEGALKFSNACASTASTCPIRKRVGKGGIKLSGGKVNFNDPR